MIKNIGIEEQVRLWDGCQAYYKFDSTGGTTALDSINDANGTVSNAAIWNSNGKNNGCMNNKGLYFATIPATVANNFYTASKFSFSFWHYSTGTTTQGFINQYGANGQRVFSFNDESYFTPKHYYRLVLGNTSGSWQYATSPDGQPETIYNAWTHVVITVDCSITTYKTYINGNLANTVSNAAGIGFKTNSTTDLKIGTDSTLYLKGRMDEVGFWNRVLRSDEVLALYSQGNGKFYGTQALLQNPLQIPNCRAWYGSYVNGGTLRTTLGNGAALTQWDDLSGNGLHLNSANGTPTYNSAKDALDFSAGVLYNVNHNIITGTTVGTIFNVSETADYTSINDYMCLGNLGAGTYILILSCGSVSNTFTTYAGTYIRWNSNPTYTNNQKYLFVFQRSGANMLTASNAKMNGNSLSINTSTSAGDFNTKIGIIGGGAYFDGSYVVQKRGTVKNYEIIVYNRVLSNREIVAVENYLKTKYSI